MKIKLLPHALVRLGGESVAVLDALKISDKIQGRITQSEQNSLELSRKREQISTELFVFISQADDQKVQQQLQNLRRDIFNGKNPRSRDLDFAKEHLPEFLLQSIQSLIDFRENSEEFHAQTAILFTKETFGIRQKYKQLLKNQAFQQGLVLSSHCLHDDLKKYLRKSPLKFTASDIQTELGLLKYLTRMTTKTSPYSTFNHLNFAKISAQNTDFKQVGDEPFESYIRLNVKLLGQIIALIKSNKNLLPNLPIRQNLSLVLKDETYHFFCQENLQDFFRKVPKTQAIPFILEAVAEHKIYQNIVEKLCEKFSAKPQAIEGYLNKLLEFGLIEINLGFSGIEPNWVEKLQGIFSEMKPSKSLEKVIKDLQKIQDLTLLFGKATASERRKLIEKTDQLFEQAFQSLSAPNIEEITVQKIKSEQIFFEDACQKASLVAPEKVFQQTAEIIERLFQYAGVDADTQKKEGLTDLFLGKMDKNPLPLLDFYEVFCVEKIMLSSPKIVPQNLLSKFDFRFDVEAQSCDLCFREKQEITPQINNSRAAFVQFFKQNNEYKAVLNGVTAGYGKLYSRFLHFFDENISQELLSWNNQTVETDEMLLENVDSSFHNANIHTNILSQEIAFSGANHNQADTDFHVLLNTLDIYFDEKTASLKLVHRPTGKRVFMADLGFQSASGRSQLFGFLNEFCQTPHQTLKYLFEEIKQKYAAENPISEEYRNGGILAINPRIILDNQIVIQRKSWVFSAESLPKKGKLTTDFDYFEKWNQWRKYWKIPSQVYVQFQADAANTKLRPDDTKPQYIAFDNPLLLNLLNQMLRKNVPIQFVEALPEKPLDFGEIIPRVSEWVLNWQTDFTEKNDLRTEEITNGIKFLNRGKRATNFQTSNKETVIL
jgi:lantibiotic biosynthesis protein